MLEDIVIKTTTIGPGSVNYSGALLERVIADVDTMVGLNWITDTVLISNIQLLLAEAAVFKADDDGTAAKANLQEVINLMAPVTEAQMRREAIDLIQINTALVVEFTPDTFIPPDLVLIVDPKDMG